VLRARSCAAIAWWGFDGEAMAFEAELRVGERSWLLQELPSRFH
jgi:hypothetical protein